MNNQNIAVMEMRLNKENQKDQEMGDFSYKYDQNLTVKTVFI